MTSIGVFRTDTDSQPARSPANKCIWKSPNDLKHELYMATTAPYKVKRKGEQYVERRFELVF